MKRENLPSILDFVNRINSLFKYPENACDYFLAGFGLGPYSEDIVKDPKLAPDTVATAIARNYYNRGGDLANKAKVNAEIIAVLESVEKRYPGCFFMMDLTGSHSFSARDAADRAKTNTFMFLPVDTTGLPSNISLNSDSVIETVSTSPKPDYSTPFFANSIGSGIEIKPIYSPPADYKKITTERVLSNRDNVFTSFFLSVTFAADFYKYFLTKCLVAVFQIILDSPYVPDDVKEAIINARYKVIDLIDDLQKSLLEDKEILYILKNTSENNEDQSNIELEKILGPKILKNTHLTNSRSPDSYSSEYLNSQSDKTKDWEFINLQGYVGTTMYNAIYRVNDESNYISCGSEADANAATDLRQTMLNNFLYNDQPVTSDQVLGLRALFLAGSVLSMLNTLAEYFGLHAIQWQKYSLRKQKYKFTHNILIDIPPIKTELLLEALAAGSTDPAELQQEINKIVSKLRPLQPKSKTSAAAVARSPFYLFVEEIGGAYDTAHMDDPQHTKQIKKILDLAAKKIAAFAGTPERSTPGDTVSYAMRVFSDDESKMDAIYDIVDKAVNDCYDLVFGEENT